MPDRYLDDFIAENMKDPEFAAIYTAQRDRIRAERIARLVAAAKRVDDEFGCVDAPLACTDYGPRCAMCDLSIALLELREPDA